MEAGVKEIMETKERAERENEEETKDGWRRRQNERRDDRTERPR